MKFRELFTEEECNTGRQDDLDIAKAFPVLMLPFTHTIIECISGEALDYGIPFLFDCYIGGPISAPVFMFAMGVGISYAYDHSPQAIIKRAGKLAVVGYLLNICRFLIPYLIGYALTGDKEQFVDPLLYKVFGNDILQFAPLALLCMAFFIKQKLSFRAMLGIGLLFSLAGWALIGIDLKSPVLNTLFGYFIPTEDAAGMVISDFPILNWLIFVIVGYIFGYYLRRLKDKASFYKIVSPLCLLVCLIYFPIAMHYEIGTFGPGENAYYHLRFYEMLAFLCLIFGMLGIYYAVSRILSRPIMWFLRQISRGMTVFYCVHWVFVIVITNVIVYILTGSQELPLPETLWIAFGIMIVTSAIVLLYERHNHGRSYVS